MKSKMEQTTKYILELTVEKAKWLRGMIQNPIPELPPEFDHEFEEDPYNRDMRQRFWTALEFPDE